MLPSRLELGHDAVSGSDILLTGYKGRNVNKLQAGEFSTATGDLANGLSLMEVGLSLMLILCTKMLQYFSHVGCIIRTNSNL